MENNNNNVIVLQILRERLTAMILAEENWIQSERDRISEMRVHVGEIEMQMNDTMNGELRSDLETSVHYYNQRIWREELHFTSMVQEFETLRNSLLRDIWMIDELIGE